MNNLQLELVKKKEKLAELKQRKLERLTKSKNEFDNLNVDQIISKCGLINDNTTISKSSSCISVSVSSSSQSLKSNSSSTTLYNGFKSFNGLENDFDNLKLSSRNNVNVIDIYPNETIKYTKETQTNTDFKLNDETESTDETTPEKRNNHFNAKSKSLSSKQKPLAYYDDIFVYDTFQWEDEFPALDLIEQEIMNNSNENIDSIIKKALSSHNANEMEQMLLKNAKSNQESNHRDITSKRVHDQSDSNEEEDATEAAAFYLSETNRPNIDSDDFLHFLKQKRPIIERALKQNENNIFFDYSALSTTEKIIDESHSVLIKLKKSFCSADKASIVTCLDWSQQYPELLLCSYDNMSFNYEEAASESVAVIWNSKSDQKTPYQNLTCSSLITSCIFSSYHPNLIIAGTYSGQIVMWDMRCNKQTPIQRSSLSITSHVNPVYCVKVIGDQEAHNLISISNDGKLCSWSLDNLNLPFESQDLSVKNATNKNVYATCFDFQNLAPKIENETMVNRYAVVGAEDGLVHSLAINNNTNSNNNSRYSTSEIFSDHLGPITGVSCYNHDSLNTDLSQLFLTSSFDGCIKLWDLMDSGSPVHTFECNGDYVYDVSWSPTHPALFASVDGSGKLDIWNLNNDFELPSASYVIDNRTRALNRLKWSKNGLEIAVGDDHGQISIFELNENFVRSSPDETNRFLNTLNTLKQINYETMRTDKTSSSYLSESIR